MPNYSSEETYRTIENGMASRVVSFQSLRRSLVQCAFGLWNALGLNRLCRTLTRQHIRVLMYHGVSDQPLGADYWLLVSKSEFEWQMSYLSGRFEVRPWDSLLESPSGTSKNATPGVVITFDDAYSNVHRNGCPILNRFAFPAVCFVIPDLSERGEEVWTTKLFRLLVESDSRRIPLELEESAELCLPAEKGARHSAARGFVNEMKNRTPAHIQRVLDSVVSACGPSDNPSVAREFALMTFDDIHDLAHSATVAIGSHSNGHYSLSTLAAADQEVLIADSLACLRRHGIQPAAVFAYPSGHFDRETVSILKTQGFKVAFTTEQGLFQPGDDPLRVRRIAVGGDMTRAEFKFQLSGARLVMARLLGRST